MAFRWFGRQDPVRLEYIRQTPGVRSVVSALTVVPVGTAFDRVAALKDEVDRAGLDLAVIESMPVHEDIKLGRTTRDRYAYAYCESIGTLGRLGIFVLCYNFMPVFDWLRTDLAVHPDDPPRSIFATTAA